MICVPGVAGLIFANVTVVIAFGANDPEKFCVAISAPLSLTLMIADVRSFVPLFLKITDKGIFAHTVEADPFSGSIIENICASFGPVRTGWQPLDVINPTLSANVSEADILAH